MPLVLKASASQDQVDWLKTLVLHARFYEWEIRLYPGSKLELDSIGLGGNL